MAKGKVLNVLYQSDDNYAMISGVSIISLLENNKHLDKINIFYCDYKISATNRRRLKNAVSGYVNANLTFIDAKPYHEEFQKLGVKTWHGVYVTWLKMLAVGDLKLSTDRVLFINGHTIINGALDELINLEFDNAVMALGYDCLINAHKKTIGLLPTDGYYNCGIMLFNHKKWLKDDIASEVKDHLLAKSDYVIADQDLCNVLFKGKIKTLNSTFNYSSAYHMFDQRKLLKANGLKPEYFYSYEELQENFYCPKIIHLLYGVKGRPWQEGSVHPQKYLWEKYLKLSPWKNTTRPTVVPNLAWRLNSLLPKSLFFRLYMLSFRKFGR